MDRPCWQPRLRQLVLIFLLFSEIGCSWTFFSWSSEPERESSSSGRNVSEIQNGYISKFEVGPPNDKDFLNMPSHVQPIPPQRSQFEPRSQSQMQTQIHMQNQSPQMTSTQTSTFSALNKHSASNISHWVIIDPIRDLSQPPRQLTSIGFRQPDLKYECLSVPCEVCRRDHYAIYSFDFRFYISPQSIFSILVTVILSFYRVKSSQSALMDIFSQARNTSLASHILCTGKIVLQCHVSIISIDAFH